MTICFNFAVLLLSLSSKIFFIIEEKRRKLAEDDGHELTEVVTHPNEDPHLACSHAEFHHENEDEMHAQDDHNYDEYQEFDEVENSSDGEENQTDAEEISDEDDYCLI